MSKRTCSPPINAYFLASFLLCHCCILIDPNECWRSLQGVLVCTRLGQPASLEIPRGLHAITSPPSACIHNDLSLHHDMLGGMARHGAKVCHDQWERVSDVLFPTLPFCPLFNMVILLGLFVFNGPITHPSDL